MIQFSNIFLNCRYHLLFRFYKFSWQLIRLLSLVTVFILSGCGGGGSDSSANVAIISASASNITETIPVPNSRAQVLITRLNKALLDNAANQITYTVSVRPQGNGNFDMTGAQYGINVALPADGSGAGLVIINSACFNLAYGGQCQFTLGYNGAAIPEPVAPNYTPNIKNFQVTVTPVAPTPGQVTYRDITVKVMPDPAQVNLAPSSNNARFLPMKTNNITVFNRGNNVSWRFQSTPVSIPTIQTYDNDYMPFVYIAAKMRCGNTLVYFSAQNKMIRALAPVNAPAGTQTHGARNNRQDNADNITVKYHPFFSIGNPGDNIKVFGNYQLSNPNSENFNTGASRKEINIHPVWSGPDNDNALRNIITTHKSNQYDYIVSILHNIDQPQSFVDDNNKGVRKIITVHSLLAPDAGQQISINNAGHNNLYDYLNANRGATIISNISNLFRDNIVGHPKTQNAETNFKAAMQAYRNQVAIACGA